MQRRHLAGAIVVVFAAAATTAIACGDSHDVADGDECSSSGDCVSNLCVGGKCAGKQCSCTGAGCPEPGPCDPGWRCSLRGTNTGALTCTRTCDTTRPCPDGDLCDEGLCLGRRPQATLEWVVKPGGQRCALGQRCRYSVRVGGEAPDRVKKIEWSFGDDAGTATGTDVDYIFPLPNIYVVEARGILDDGHVGPRVQSEETVCIADTETICSPASNFCCSGTCTLEGKCR